MQIIRSLWVVLTKYSKKKTYLLRSIPRGGSNKDKQGPHLYQMGSLTSVPTVTGRGSMPGAAWYPQSRLVARLPYWMTSSSAVEGSLYRHKTDVEQQYFAICLLRICAEWNITYYSYYYKWHRLILPIKQPVIRFNREIKLRSPRCFSIKLK